MREGRVGQRVVAQLGDRGDSARSRRKSTTEQLPIRLASLNRSASTSPPGCVQLP